MKSEEIKKVLSFDALQEAENMTGKSYKEDKGTEGLGFAMHIEHGKKKEALLSSLGDSTLSNTEQNYLDIVKSIGFESVLIEPFVNEDNIEERLHVMWHNEYSILLVFDTHTWGDDGSWTKTGQEVPPPSVNGGSFYYNWSPNFDCKNHCTSTGGNVGNGDTNRTYSSLFNADHTPHILPNELREIEPVLDWENYDEYRDAFDRWRMRVKEYIRVNELVSVWSGHHDCREAIKFNISELNKNGSFVKKWIEKPFLWLLHYMDTKDENYDHEKITLDRLKKLPKHVLEAMNV